MPHRTTIGPANTSGPGGQSRYQRSPAPWRQAVRNSFQAQAQEVGKSCAYRRIGHTGSPHSTPSDDNCRLSTLKVTVRGSSALTLTYDGHCLGPKSGCSARKARNFSGSNSLPGASTNAAITWSPTTGSGTAYTATSVASG